MSSNPYDYCKYCKAEMPKRKHKRYRSTMCRDCQMDKKDGNPKLKKIFDFDYKKNRTNFLSKLSESWLQYSIKGRKEKINNESTKK